MEACHAYLDACRERHVRPCQAVTQQLAAGCATIDVGGTYVGPRGATCIVAALRAAPSVRSVCLSGNHLGNETTIAIARELVQAPHVRNVDLSGNEAISAAGARTLQKLVRLGRLDEVRLGGTSVPAAMRKLLRIERVAAPDPAEAGSSSRSVPADVNPPVVLNETAGAGERAALSSLLDALLPQSCPFPRVRLAPPGDALMLLLEVAVVDVAA